MDETGNISENDLASDTLALLMQVLTADDGKRVVRVVLPEASKSAAPNEANDGVFWVKRFGIEEQIERIYRRNVPLESGGSIVIDPTEAYMKASHKDAFKQYLQEEPEEEFV